MKNLLIGIFTILALPAIAQNQLVLDNTFATAGVHTNVTPKLADAIIDLALTDDGKIIGLVFTSDDFINGQVGLCKFNTNGTLDNSFGTNGISALHGAASKYSYGKKILIQTDGKILLATNSADTTSTNQNPEIMQIVRYNSNGSIDNTFGTSGVAIVPATGTYKYDVLADMALQSDGKILCCRQGDPSIVSSAIIRLNSSGAVDNTFGTSGVKILGSLIGEYLTAVAVNTDGTIIAGGYRGHSTGTNTYNYVLAYKLNTSGNLISTFGTSGKMIDSIAGYSTYSEKLIIQPDGKILFGGSKYPFGSNIAKSYILRTNSDGSRDLSFNSVGYNEFTYNNNDNALGNFVLNNDGSITALSPGYATAGSAYLSIYKIKANGTNDNTFNASTNYKHIPNYAVGDDGFGLAIQKNDAKILVSNADFNGTTINSFLLRFETQFPASLSNASAKAIKVYPNPSTDFINIDLVNNNNNATIIISNATGKIIYTQEVNKNTIISTANFAKGIYNISATIDNVSYNEAVLVK
jgi:uncharacterized delta-60 repeat protein